MTVPNPQEFRIDHFFMEVNRIDNRKTFLFFWTQKEVDRGDHDDRKHNQKNYSIHVTNVLVLMLK